MSSGRRMGGLACVVVLNWNGRKFIRDCLRSVLGQRYPSYRVVVVDNASTDGSQETIRQEFPEATLVPLATNLHFARGTNAGIQEALKDPKCAFVSTLNNDTRVDPDWLGELVRAAGEGVGLVASKMLFMDRPQVLNSTGLSIGPDGSGLDRGWNQPDEGQYDTSRDVFGPSAGAALYRREVLDGVGLFDADFVAYYEDLDLAWRARLAGWEARFAPGAIVHHKFSAAAGAGSSQKTYFCERNRVWNLIQNYPWRYVVVGIPWNSARVLARPLSRNHPSQVPVQTNQRSLLDRTGVLARARLDAYRGIRRALAKRKGRQKSARVDLETVGHWIRVHGVSLKASIRA